MGKIIPFPDRCQRCGRSLRGYIRVQIDGRLLCVTCAGNSQPVPDDVQRKVEDMERKHGKRRNQPR